MRVQLTKVRLSFPDLFEAVQYQGKGAFRYNATFLVVPGSANDKAIREAISTAATEAWGAKAPAMLKTLEPQSNKYCYIDGNNKEYDGYEGHFYLAAHRAIKNGPPAVKDKNGKTTLTEADGRVYGGCYVNAVVDIYAQTGDHTGIRANLLGVQFHSKGDAFSSARLSEDAFSAVEEGADAEDIV